MVMVGQVYLVALQSEVQIGRNQINAVGTLESLIILFGHMSIERSLDVNLVIRPMRRFC